VIGEGGERTTTVSSAYGDKSRATYGETERELLPAREDQRRGAGRTSVAFWAMRRAYGLLRSNEVGRGTVMFCLRADMSMMEDQD
jgi:hypothetical protein